jgi:hypothetical protein
VTQVAVHCGFVPHNITTDRMQLFGVWRGFEFGMCDCRPATNIAYDVISGYMRFIVRKYVHVQCIPITQINQHCQILVRCKNM